jgi:glycolate oxidase FAD binding subunit
MKNVAGYDVSRLMAGAMGTLGLIAEVSLKVLPVAPAEATLVFECTQAEALRQLCTWAAQPLPLNASRWRGDGDGDRGVLHLRLRGAAAAVEAACRALGGERVDAAASTADWMACRDHRLDWFVEGEGRDLWRLSLPPSAPALALPDAPLVEWLGGLRWVRLRSGDASSAQRLRQTAAEAGGHATLFRTAGEQEPPSLSRFHPLDPVLDRIHRELKRQFDPAGIFNRGRLSPDF